MKEHHWKAMNDDKSTKANDNNISNNDDNIADKDTNNNDIQREYE